MAEPTGTDRQSAAERTRPGSPGPDGSTADARPGDPWRGLLLWSLVIVQSVAGSYLLWTILAALLGLPEPPLRWQAREILDLAAALGLVTGAVFSVRLAIRAVRAGTRAETARRLSAGAFTRVVDDHFATIALTDAERDVAWYIVKGFAQTEIARLRGTAEGTVRAQSTAIYRKAGVKGRGQLVAQIVEDLLL